MEQKSAQISAGSVENWCIETTASTTVRVVRLCNTVVTNAHVNKKIKHPAKLVQHITPEKIVPNNVNGVRITDTRH